MHGSWDLRMEADEKTLWAGQHLCLRGISSYHFTVESGDLVVLANSKPSRPGPSVLDFYFCFSPILFQTFLLS